MKRLLGCVRLVLGFGLAAALVTLTGALPAIANPAGTMPVISQVYGGGGNTGATYTNDFVELFNPTASTFPITGWSVQYASATGTGNFSGNPVTVLSGNLGPGQYYLVQLAGGATGSGLPTPDAIGTANLSGSSGKVVLANVSSGLACNGGSTPCSPADLAQIADLVGYGSANFFEGAAAAPGLSNTTAALRAVGGCTDTDQNGNEFTAGTPNPRNTASPTHSCAASTDPSGAGAAVPSPVAAGGSVLLTVSVTPGANPTSTDLAVVADLTAIGGSATQSLFDDGTNGDVTPGDNTFSLATTVAGGTSAGGKTLPATITDAQARTGSASIGLIVSAGPPSPGSVVVSEVYGGGGNSGATLTNDFIELYNRTASPIDLTGWSVQYASAGGTSWQVTSLSGSIPAGKNYLVQEAAGSGGTTTLPAPDATGSIPMSATSGKVALVSSASALSGACPTGGGIIDFVGYGATASCFEGSGPTAGLSNTTSALRNGGGATDTDNNASDFTVGTPDPHASADQAPAVSTTTPANGASGVALGANLTITFTEPVNVTGSWFTIVCGTSGAHAASASGGPTSFTLDPTTDFASDETCTVTVLAANVTDQDTEDPPDNMAASSAFSFQTVEVLVCGSGVTPIHDVQGAGLATPVPGGKPIIQGIVVGDFQAAGSFGGFYLEEPAAFQDANPATSEGIFVFDGNFGVDVHPGDSVIVHGTVTEFFDLTELTNVTAVQVCSAGNPLPPAAAVSLPVASLDDLEPFEGMLVHFGQTLTATEVFNLGRFGEVSLSGVGRLYNPTAVAAPGAPAQAVADQNNRSRIILDDGDNQQNIDPTIYPQGGLSATNTLRVGDTLPGLTGVMDYRFSNYRIQPVAPLTFDHANPRTPAPAAVGGNLKVASFNVLNFFNGDGLGGGFPTSRGANTQLELDRQKAKEVSALEAIDADVVGLMEIENDAGPVSAIAELVAALNAATAPGTYAYIDTGVIGTDEIKVALIYKPAVVTPVGPWKIITTATDSRFLDTFNRPSLAQTFQKNANGGVLTVVVQHLKSKGSACDSVGDPDAGDGQGNCNLTRTNAAKALVDWLATDPTGSGDPDYLLIGDFNSYTFEDPIDWITSHGYTNLVRQFGGLSAYSYVFNGESGYLDHGLASTALAAQVTGATDWHINPDEPTVLDYNVEFKTANQVNTFYDAGPYRSSDHDPVVIGLNLTAQCFGVPATIVGSGTIVGTNGPDVIVGGAGNDTISGGNGNDLICGGPGDDLIDGGNGNDRIAGDAATSFGDQAAPGGNDTILGGNGDDEILGEAGNDTIDGGTGDDFATGNVGSDTVSGGNGNDELFGGTGPDVVDGGNGNDSLFGTYGDDILNGGNGNDFLDGDLPPDNDVGSGPGVDPTPGNTDTCNGGNGRDQAFGCEIRSAIEVVIASF